MIHVPAAVVRTRSPSTTQSLRLGPFLLRLLTRIPAFPDGFAYLWGAIDQEELLLVALVKQAVNQGVVLGVLYVPSLYLVVADKFGQASTGLGDGPGLGRGRFSRGGWNMLLIYAACTVELPPVAWRFDCFSERVNRPRPARRRSRLPRKAWRLGSRNQEGNTLHTFPLPHLRNMTVSVPRSEAVLAPLAMSVTAAPGLSAAQESYCWSEPQAAVPRGCK